jgi:hypothetical protein
LLVASSLAAQAAKSYTLSPAWEIAPMTPYEWASTNNHQRGLAFNPVTGDLITLSRYPAFAAAGYVLNSTNGTLKSSLNVTGVKTDMNFPLNTVGVAADGVIYACNLAVNSKTVPSDPMGNNGPFRIYRWTSADATPQLVYEGDPSNNDPINDGARFGDAIAVRGSGATTEILLGNRYTNTFSLFRTTDGVNFQPAVRIQAPDIGTGITQSGLAWGTNNSFYVKCDSGDPAKRTAVQHFSYDDTGAATLIKNHDTLKNLGGPIAYDSTKGLLAIANVLVDTGIPSKLRLFKDTIAGMVQQDHPAYERLFSATYKNGNATGVAVFGGNRLFALSSNNGIVAYDIVEKEVTPQIFWTETGGWAGPEQGIVWSAAFDGSGKNPVAAALSRPIGIDLDYTNKLVYWAEDGVDAEHPSRIMRAGFDGSNVTELYKGDFWGFANAQMMKLDLAGGKVYFLAFGGGVWAGKLDGTECTWLGGHPNGTSYTAMDLDLVNHRIYYADPQQSGVLFRMDNDAQNNVEVTRGITGGDWGFNGMHLDVANNHIYFADGIANQIKRMNLDGTSPTVLVPEAGLYPLDVVLAPNGKMYWTAPDSLSICSANLDGSNVTTNLVSTRDSAFGIAVVPVAPAVPALVSIKVNGSTATISWAGGAGTFQLQKRTSLTSGSWENVGSPTTATEATDPKVAGGCFYRVVSTR